MKRLPNYLDYLQAMCGAALQDNPTEETRLIVSDAIKRIDQLLAEATCEPKLVQP